MNRISGRHPGGPAAARKKVGRFRAGFLILSAWLLLAVPVHSQDSTHLVVGGLDTDNFPAIHFNLEAYDSQGNFIDDLTPDEISLTEDDQEVDVASMEVIEPGIQFSVAITPGQQLAVNIGGRPQIEGVRAALTNWARKQSAQSGLDFSLSANTGLQVIRSREPQEWAAALAKLQVDPQRTDVNLFSLSTALDLASDQAINPLMKRAILFITPPVPEAQLAGLQELSARAQQAGVRVFVWVPVTSLEGDQPDTSALQALADSTGGRMTLVAAPETMPDLETWLAPLRKSYEVQFLSNVKTSGDHSITVSLADGSAAERTMGYSLTLNAPNPIFLSPPAEVERTWSVPEGSQDLALSPESQELSFVVEFPDGYSRPLTAARLYQNGVLLVENTVPPFDHFTWDLTPITVSGTYSMRVEVLDSLDLAGTSVETPVQVVVQPRPATTLFERISQSGLIAVGAVLLAGIVLGMVLVGENRLRGRRKRGDKRRMEDPVTQPVPIQQDLQVKARGKHAASEPGSWPKTAPAQAVTARLLRVTEDEHAVPGSLIPLNRSEITLGSDARQAVILVEDASVDKLHARLVRNDDGCFTLTDENSVAGTWVNYTPVPADGVRLEHEDLIHLGRAMFRFELSNAPAARPPAVETVEKQE